MCVHVCVRACVCACVCVCEREREISLWLPMTDRQTEGERQTEGGRERETIKNRTSVSPSLIVQELCESRGGRPGLSVLTSLLVSVDVKIYCTMLRHWSQLVPNMSTDI